jgi:hypothetical protein
VNQGKAYYSGLKGLGHLILRTTRRTGARRCRQDVIVKKQRGNLVGFLSAF